MDNYDMDTFCVMIDDWRADGAPEYDDLIIDEIAQEYGRWIAAAHDDTTSYTLTDDGEHNIIIHYDSER